MELNINDDSLVEKPSIDSVRYEIDSLGLDQFVVLSRDDDHYVQAYRNPDGTFQLEYRDGSESEHYETVAPPDIDVVEQAFIRYCSDMTDWRSPWEWQEIEFDN